jgi:hypothetical protein
MAASLMARLFESGAAGGESKRVSALAPVEYHVKTIKKTNSLPLKFE